jgi:hypothetical protein
MSNGVRNVIPLSRIAACRMISMELVSMRTGGQLAPTLSLSAIG